MIPKKWPDWTISPIAFAVIIVIILLGSIVVPIVSRISPKDEPPIIKEGDDTIWFDEIPGMRRLPHKQRCADGCCKQFCYS